MKQSKNQKKQQVLINSCSPLSAELQGVTVTRGSLSVDSFLSNTLEHPLQASTRTKRAGLTSGRHVQGLHHVLHEEVAVVVLKGQKLRANANTRAEAWRLNYLTRPDKLHVTYYHCFTEEQSHAVFRVFDNKCAVETSRQILIGNLKATGIEPTTYITKSVGKIALKFFRSDVSATGEEIGSMLDAAGLYSDIDKVGIEVPDAKDKKAYRQGILGAILSSFEIDKAVASMFLKGYDNESVKATKRDSLKEYLRGLDRGEAGDKKAYNTYLEDFKDYMDKVKNPQKHRQG